IAGSGQERGIDPESGRSLCIAFARSVVRVVPSRVLLDVLLEVSLYILLYFLLYSGAGFVRLGFIALRLIVPGFSVLSIIVLRLVAGSNVLRASSGFFFTRLCCGCFRFWLSLRRLRRLLFGSLLSGLDCGRKQIIGSHVET